MLVKNNYNECITNLACSIRKYFELDYKHNTIDYIDKILEERKPKNVVTILFDGMGSNIIDNILSPDSFMIKNRLKKITTIFPATTVAATTTIRTGLNPIESGMLGWYMYFKDIDKTIEIFPECEKGDETKTPLPEVKRIKEKYMKTKTIVDDINKANKYKGYELMPFEFEKYKYYDLDDMLNKIGELCSQDGKKYIYAYDTEPDSVMHSFGTYSGEVKDLIRYRNIMVEKLCDKLEDTVVFIIADHGHVPVENIHLEDYPDILDCMKRDFSLDSRAVNFFIKDGMKERFVEIFNKYFKDDFDLYTMQDIIDSKLFGDGEENEIFRSALGDFLAIAKGNKTINYHKKNVKKSHHAGYTDDEIYVPLIVVKR